MTTAFTAIPVKITISTKRLRGTSIGEPYSTAGGPIIDRYQVGLNAMGLANV
jgi:hypothetical protein